MRLYKYTLLSLFFCTQTHNKHIACHSPLLQLCPAHHPATLLHPAEKHGKMNGTALGKGNSEMHALCQQIKQLLAESHPHEILLAQLGGSQGNRLDSLF